MMASWDKPGAAEPDKLRALRVRATDEAPLSQFHQGQRAQMPHAKSECMAATCSLWLIRSGAWQTGGDHV